MDGAEGSGAVPERLLALVRDALVATPGPVSPERVGAALRAGTGPVPDTLVLAVHDALLRELSGAGPLEALLGEPGVTDVLVNGPDRVWVDRGAGLELTGLHFRGEDAVRALAQRLAAAAGRRLDDSVPHVDVRLPGGVRLHAVLAPVARPGTLLSLRVPAATTFSLDDLVAAGTLAPAGAALLRRILAARLAFVISGGTGSGKTTVLNALLGEVPAGERIVLVEDSAELRPCHPHVVGLEARTANIEGAGALSLRTLVRQALRMRPDRVVVGEVRGEEVVDLLAALNTGHEGGCGTLHANGAGSVPDRVVALATAAGLSREAALSQCASALDLVLHLDRRPGGPRRLREVGVVVGGAAGCEVRTAVRFATDGEALPGPGLARLEELLDR